MKYCVECGSQLGDKDIFCTNCGAKVALQEPAPAPAHNSAPQVAPVAQTAPKEAVINNPGVVYVNTQTPAPVGKLKTNRGLLKYILLSLITFGIYGLVVMSAVGTDINQIAGRHDGRKTMHYCLIVFLFSWLTFGIASFVWYHRVSNRIGAELERRGIAYKISAGTFWGWCVLGSIIIVGPFIYIHKLLKAMNLLAENYNMYG